MWTQSAGPAEGRRGGWKGRKRLDLTDKVLKKPKKTTKKTSTKHPTIKTLPYFWFPHARGLKVALTRFRCFFFFLCQGGQI